MSEERIPVTINISADLYAKIDRISRKILYVPSVENFIVNLIDEWDSKTQGE